MDMKERFSELNDVELGVMAVAGLALMFLGYRIKKVAFFVIWFLLGYTLMGYLMPEIAKFWSEATTNDVWRVALPIVGGLLVGLLGFTIEKICVGGIAFGLTLAITAQYFGTEMQTLLIGGVIGAVVAGVAVMLMKPAIIVATAAAGAYMLTAGILTWIPTIDSEVFYFPILIGSTVVGAAVQFLTTRRL